jgi:orotidine-5'-phosphate decarboxylase
MALQYEKYAARPMLESFGLRLVERLRDQGGLCLGIDPSSSTLLEWERPDSVEGLEYFSRALVELAIEEVAIIKPQVAYFERFGSKGYAILEQVLSEAREAGLLTIADVKRGDIGSTNLGYAQAWLDERSPLRVDALTVSPYLGVGSLEDVFDFARERGRGAFVLAATSNPEGRQMQRAHSDDGERLEHLVLRSIREYNRRDEGFGSIGAVVGATRDDVPFEWESMAGPFLVPGVGAQGATIGQVARMFERASKGSVVVPISRAITQAGPSKSGLRDAMRRFSDEVRDSF